MSSIDYAIAWRRDDPKLLANVKAFWKSIGLGPAMIEERASDLCNVAYADGKVIGVTTVKLRDHPPLRCRLGFLRCAVASEYRKHYLATFLTRDSLTILEGWSLENPQEKVLGLAFLIEADELGSKAVYPMWADWNTHYNLVGFAPGDKQARLAWFRHARFDPTPA